MALDWQERLKSFLDDIGFGHTGGDRPANALWKNTYNQGIRFQYGGNVADWQNQAALVAEMVKAVDVNDNNIKERLSNVRSDQGNSAIVSATSNVSRTGQQQIESIIAIAERGSGGKKGPWGNCYRVVWSYIVKAHYGNMPAGGPFGDQSEARKFAEYANVGNHCAQMGIQRLHIDNPYNAPRGALVVVRPGSPGTSNKTAGDIAIALGNGRFLNDNEMGYGGSHRFPPGNNYVLGVYLPV